MARVWDPLVRVFHWSLAASFAVAWFTPGDSGVLHQWAGFAAAGLVAIRVLWGFLGTPYARFSQFVRHPAEVLAYLRDIAAAREARHLGHNPAGGAMIVALLHLAGVALASFRHRENLVAGMVTGYKREHSDADN
ncbi:MAG: cytochrome B [Rhizobiales bacterium]|nr:cytochrome B [Hyphomicrobiales bacterium]